jgi:hypothetical protein
LKINSNVPRGVLLLARGKAAGITAFGSSTEALTASLAPLIAFPLVGSVLAGIDGAPLAAAIGFLSRLCAVLAVSVITYEFARITKRESLWVRTATALNWSFWMIIPLLAIAGLLGMAMVSAGLPVKLTENIMFGLMGAYLLWYHWFTVRTGLQLTILPAIGLVFITNLAVAILTLGPALVTLASGGEVNFPTAGL